MLKKALFVFLLCCLSIGCSSRVNSIATGSELLEGGPFSFRYPEDWKFIGKNDSTNPARIKSLYYFTHPKNPNCRISIRILKFPFGRKISADQISNILSEEIRSFQDTFTEEGFQNFRIDTSSGILGTAKAKKLILSAVRSGIIREIVLYTLHKRNNVFIVSYQWDNDWAPQAKKRLLKAMQTFRLK